MLVCAPSRGVFKNVEKTVNNIVIRVECLVRSEFTVPGWTEFTITFVSVREHTYITVEDGFFPVFLKDWADHLRTWLDYKLTKLICPSVSIDMYLHNPQDLHHLFFEILSK